MRDVEVQYGGFIFQSTVVSQPSLQPAGVPYMVDTKDILDLWANAIIFLTVAMLFWKINFTSLEAGRGNCVGM